jgi:hypothetical protein
MKSHSRVVVVAFATVGQFVAVSARAQAADSLTKGKSDGSIAVAAPVDTSVHKKGGMFGKLKSVAHNKTVQTITKAAVCQALPGGQYMIGAAEAAKNKTSISSGVANAQSCIPGMGGAGLAGGVGGMGGKGVLANAAVGAAGSLGAGAIAGKPAAGAAKGLPGIPGMPGMPGMPGRAGAMTSTAQGAAGIQMATEQMKAASIATGGTGGGEITTEASGEQMKLSGTVTDEIKKGKLVIKKIDWVHGNPSVSAPATQGFMDLMLSAGQAMKAAGGNYRVDVYMDKKYSDAEIATLGAQRTTVVVSSLQAGGQLGEAVVPGKIGKDKEQRIEIVKVK